MSYKRWEINISVSLVLSIKEMLFNFYDINFYVITLQFDSQRPRSSVVRGLRVYSELSMIIIYYLKGVP